MHSMVQTALAGAVFSSKLGQGMLVSPGDYTLLRREPSLIIRSLLVAWTMPLLVTVLVVTCLKPPHATVIGLTLAAACPAPPLLMAGAISIGARPAYAATLQRLLSISAVFLLPLLLKCAAHLLGLRATVGPLIVMRQVALAVFVPTAAGMLMRGFNPTFSSRLQPKLSKVGTYGYMLVGAIVLWQVYPKLPPFGWRSYTSVLVITIASLVLGQALGPAHEGDGRALALACASRNTGLAFLIASINYPSQAAMHHLIPYLFVSTVCTMSYELWASRSRTSATRQTWNVNVSEADNAVATHQPAKRPAFLR